jgi:hypothetical protein
MGYGEINRINNITDTYFWAEGCGNIPPSHLRRRWRQHNMQVWGNLSNYPTCRDDNPTCRPVHHRRLGISSQCTGEGVHVGTLVHAMHCADAVHLDGSPAEWSQNVDNGIVLRVWGQNRKTRHKQDEVGCAAEAIVGFHPYYSLHDPALALYDWSGQPIVRYAAGHNQWTFGEYDTYRRENSCVDTFSQEYHCQNRHQ